MDERVWSTQTEWYVGPFKVIPYKPLTWKRIGKVLFWSLGFPFIILYVYHIGALIASCHP